MTYRCIQKFQFILHTQFFELSAGCGIHFCILAAVSDIDLIYITHQIQRFLFTNMFIESTAEIVGDVIFAIRESTGTAETAHDRTGFTFDTGFYFLSVNRTVSFVQRISFFENCNFEIFVLFHQLIGGKNSSWSGSDNYHIIFHTGHIPFVKKL